MKKGWTVQHAGIIGEHNIIEVCNYFGLNKVVNYFYPNEHKSKYNKNTVGYWKVKK